MSVPAQWVRRQRWSRAAAFALLLAAAAMGAIAAPPAQAQSQDKSAVLVLDANSGRVLHESSADAPRHPASLAKMMTLYLAFELIEQGRLTYQTRIKFSANAAGAAPSKLDVEEGAEIALVDAMKVLITKSANDVAIAIAEHIAGSEDKFARLMTQKARQLGMTATLFRNASGLPDDEQITTARDMATLALRLQDDFPTHYPLFGTRTFTYNDATFRNHNTLLFHYEGTDGLKTGYTRASGFNLVSSVRRGRKHVIGVVFGGASAAARNAAMRTFLNMGLVKASVLKTRKPSAPLIARAGTAPPPRMVAVPSPQKIERPVVAVAPVAPPAPPGAPQAAPSQTPALGIEIARVRPVLVGPRAPASQPQPVDSLAPGQPASIEALLEGQPPPPSEAAAQQQPVPLWASAARELVPTRRAAPTELPSIPPPVAEADSARGAPPSTLDQQVANLSRGATPVATPPPAPPSLPQRAQDVPQRLPALPATTKQSTASIVPAGGFHIQIGAFQNEAEAQRQLALARDGAPVFLAKRVPVTLQVRQGDKLFYRARYAGFEAQAAAASACSELKRLKLDCIVVKAE